MTQSETLIGSTHAITAENEGRFIEVFKTGSVLRLVLYRKPGKPELIAVWADKTPIDQSKLYSIRSWMVRYKMLRSFRRVQSLINNEQK